MINKKTYKQYLKWVSIKNIITEYKYTTFKSVCQVPAAFSNMRSLH